MMRFSLVNPQTMNNLQIETHKGGTPLNQDMPVSDSIDYFNQNGTFAKAGRPER